jgi:hypothetical protein
LTNSSEAKAEINQLQRLNDGIEILVWLSEQNLELVFSKKKQNKLYTLFFLMRRLKNKK